MKYLVYGAGGTGGCLAAFLAMSGKDVSLIARGAHRDAIEENGLVLETGHGTFAVPIPAFEQERYGQQPDVIFVCVKGYSLEGIFPTLERLCRPETIVIPILNVVGTGGVVFGPRTPEEYRPELKQVAQDLNECGVEAILSDNIQRDAWMKFSVVSSMATCGIFHDVKVGAMQHPGPVRDNFAAFVNEIGALAAAMGFPLGDDLPQHNLAIQDALDPDASTSLKRDLDAGKPSEVDGLIFQVVRLGRQYGVPTPRYDAVAAKLGYVEAAQ